MADYGVSHPAAFDLLRGRAGSTGLFVASAIVHLIAVWAAHSGALYVRGYWLEMEVVLIISIAFESFAFVAKRKDAFRIYCVVRLAIVMIATRMLRTEAPLLSVLLSSTLLVETAVFDSGRPRTILITVVLVGLIGTSATLLGSDTSPQVLLFLFQYGITLIAVAGGLLLLDFYRQELADCSTRHRASENTIASLSKANQAFQRYSENLEDESAERERNRIASDLHDAVGYALTNVIVMMKAARITLDTDPEAVSALLERVEAQSSTALTDVRSTLHRMKAISRPKRHGYQSIFGLAKAFEGATKIQVQVHRGNLPDTLGPRLDTTFYRIVQEALTNSFRHGQASEITIAFWQSADDVTLVISDNGRGSKVAASGEDGMGLTNMRSRLAPVGGTLTTKAEESGFELSITVPFRIGRLSDSSSHR